MFTADQLAAATSPETAVVIPDYPYGFRLRCMMRVWIEFRKGKGFRYCTQTTNPKKPGTVWNAPKCSTYARIAAAIGIDGEGHLFNATLTEYSDLPEYELFLSRVGENLCPEARASLAYFRDVKLAYAAKAAELGVSNIFDATPEHRAEIKKAAFAEVLRHTKAGTAY